MHDSTARQSMTSRLGVGSATKHLQAPILFIEDLVATCVDRPRTVPTQDNLADLPTKTLPTKRLRHLFANFTAGGHPQCTTTALPSCSATTMPCLHCTVVWASCMTTSRYTCHSVQCQSPPLAFTLDALHVEHPGADTILSHSHVLRRLASLMLVCAAIFTMGERHLEPPPHSSSAW